jgi:hypothetical protein
MKYGAHCRASTLSEKANMWSRRDLLLRAGAACLTPAFSACRSGPSYDEVAGELWRDAPVPGGDRRALLTALVR